MTDAPPDPRLQAIEAALHRALAVARLGPRAPDAERENARETLALLACISSTSTRTIVLARCTPHPKTGEMTSWAVIARDSRLSEAEARAHHLQGLTQIARAVSAG